jgi:hypothetical protein
MIDMQKYRKNMNEEEYNIWRQEQWYNSISEQNKDIVNKQVIDNKEETTTSIPTKEYSRNRVWDIDNETEVDLEQEQKLQYINAIVDLGLKNKYTIKLNLLYRMLTGELDRYTYIQLVDYIDYREGEC